MPCAANVAKSTSVKGKLIKVGKVGSIYSTKCLFPNIPDFGYTGGAYVHKTTKTTKSSAMRTLYV